MPTSDNGWRVRTTSSGLDPLSWITGRVLPGDVHAVFDHLCLRFAAEVEPIIQAHSWGWAYRPIRGGTRFSNHASGTAIDLNAPAHPMGRRNTFDFRQRGAIRAILADLDGVIRWGGNYTGRPDDMHFEINTDQAAVARVAARLRQEASTPMVTLSSPMEGRFTSGYDPNRYIRSLGFSPHLGVDVAPPRAGTMGTTVHAIEGGTVIRTVRGRRPGQSASSGAVIHPGISGNGVKIRGGSGRVWVEAHVTPSVKVGQRVQAGDKIGVTDVSGRTTGPHVHCSLITHGRWTDPTLLLSRNGVRLGGEPRGGASGGTRLGGEPRGGASGGTKSGSHARRRYGKGDVARLQRRLNALGYDAGPADDFYGAKTAAAVEAYQRGQAWPGLVADADWGPATLAHYNWTIVLQKHINRFTGPSATSTGKVKRLRVDGDYRQVTAQAVLDIRQANDAAGAGDPTGAAGPVFCRWLNRSVTGVGRTLYPHPQDR